MSYEDQNLQNNSQNIPEAVLEDFLSLGNIHLPESDKGNASSPKPENVEINDLYFIAAGLLVANQDRSQVVPEEAGLRQTYGMYGSNGNKLRLSWNVRAHTDDRTRLQTDAPLRGYYADGRTRYHTPIDIEVTDASATMIQQVQVIDSGSERPNGFEHAQAIDYQLPGETEDKHMSKLAVKALGAELHQHVSQNSYPNS